ncbi:MAG: 16S rRNA processing protein RimM [Actinobacteria bacterium]|nr:16S rRNA processing protein RimM [Actinomycetota bacterium]
MSGKKNSFEIIGIIGKPHGIKGFVYVRMFTGYPDSILKNIKFYADETANEEMVFEQSANLTGKNGPRTVIKFKGVNSRNEAESLRGKSLYGFISEKKLDDGTYHIDDLAGCAVYAPGGTLLGYVTEVQNYISNDVLFVEPLKKTLNKKNFKKNLIMIPMIEDYIENIDIELKKINLSIIPEYI